MLYEDSSTSIPATADAKTRSTAILDPGWLELADSEGLMVKLSFKGKPHLIEDEIIDRCRSDQPDESFKIHWPSIVPFTETIQTGQTRGENLSDRLKGRALRCSIQEELLPLIGGPKTAEDFAQVFFDIVQAHHWLYTKAGIIHGNINPSNIRLYYKGDQVYGVLIHHDVPTFVDHTIRVQLDVLIGQLFPEAMSNVVGEFGKLLSDNANRIPMR